MTARQTFSLLVVVAGLTLLASIVSGCGQKEPAPAVTQATGRTAPPALHDFEADSKNNAAQKSEPAPTASAPAFRRVPPLHDFEADRKKAKK